MVNKKGWVRIVEAVLAIMLLSGFLTFILINQSSKNSFEEYAYNIQSSLMKEVSKNPILEVSTSLSFAFSLKNTRMIQPLHLLTMFNSSQSRFCCIMDFL